MKSKVLIIIFFIGTIVFSCSNSVEYSEAFKKDTAGHYLYNLDDIIEVYYENNILYLNWRGGKIEPVAIDENEFFVADMYKKFRFVEHPKTKERYLSIISENNTDKVTYDYLKTPKGYKTPSTHLKEGNYEKALTGYLEIKKQDSTSTFINEHNFNKQGYRLMRDNEYEKAIEVFKLNVVLHPTSANVYYSLGQAYLVSGDSLQAYNNYKKTLEFNNGNKRAKKYITNFESEL